MTEAMNRQEAPYPLPLLDLVEKLNYRVAEGWLVWLEDVDRGQDSKGLTLVVQRAGPDTYHPKRTLHVNHYFPVPPAAYDMRSWRRWLFDRLGDVDTHERCENFMLRTPGDPDGMQGPGPSHERPYAPSHGPGQDPYLVREVGMIEDVRTSFRGELNPE